MNYAIILSGGTGTRLGGDIPKQYIEVEGRPVIAFCFARVLRSPYIDGICIVAAEEWQEHIRQKCDGADKAVFALPGRNRQESIYHGLCRIRSAKPDTVFIHDAARPNLTEEMIRDYYEALEGFEGVLPVLPMKDTVYFSEDTEAVSSLLPREKVFAGQAPELFRFQRYLEANEALLPENILKINGSTEPAVMAGMRIRMVPGDENNFKITTPKDLERFAAEVRQAGLVQ